MDKLLAVEVYIIHRIYPTAVEATTRTATQHSGEIHTDWSYHSANAGSSCGAALIATHWLWLPRIHGPTTRPASQHHADTTKNFSFTTLWRLQAAPHDRSMPRPRPRDAHALKTRPCMI